MNENSKIKTPSIDRLAGEGMRFTDAHSASAVCHAPRDMGFSLGGNPWRTPMKSGVLGGFFRRR